MPKKIENNAAKMFEQFAQQGAESSGKALIEPLPIPFEKNPCVLTEGKFEAMPLPKGLCMTNLVKNFLNIYKACGEAGQPNSGEIAGDYDANFIKRI